MSDNFEKYKGTINGLYRETKEALWTPAFATVVLLSVGILIVTIFFNAAFFSFGNLLIAVLVYLLETAFPIVLLFLHRRKIYETMREKTLAMEATHPGITEAYQTWRARVEPPLG